MNPVLSNMSLTLAQSPEQSKLGIVAVGYSYRLENPLDPAIKDSGLPFVVCIDILGDDVLTDDRLALGVDEHSIDCAPGNICPVQRQLIVAQGLLDEDVGDDEIKLQIRVSRDGTELLTAMTPIVRGKF